MAIYCHLIIVLIVPRLLIPRSTPDYALVLTYRTSTHTSAVLAATAVHLNMGWHNLPLIWGMSNKHLYVPNNESYIKT